MGILGETDADIEAYLISIISNPDFLNKEWPILTNENAFQSKKIPAKPFVLICDKDLKALDDKALENKIKSDFGRNDIIVIRDRMNNPSAMQDEIFKKVGSIDYSPLNYRRYQIRACAATALFHRLSPKGLELLNKLKNDPKEDVLFVQTINFILKFLKSSEHWMNMRNKTRNSHEPIFSSIHRMDLLAEGRYSVHPRNHGVPSGILFGR